MFLEVHKNIDKVYRITILEKEIYLRLTKAMTTVMNISLHKKTMLKTTLVTEINNLQSDLVVVKSFLSFLLQKKLVSEGFYLNAYRKVESISKQLIGWCKFLVGKDSMS
jgi:hypothetical protein